MKRTLRRGVMALLLVAATQGSAFAQTLRRFGMSTIQYRCRLGERGVPGLVDAWPKHGTARHQQQFGGPICRRSRHGRSLWAMSIHNKVSSGARFTIGMWVNGDSTTGVEFSAFYLQPTSAVCRGVRREWRPTLPWLIRRPGRGRNYQRVQCSALLATSASPRPPGFLRGAECGVQRMANAT